jgi:hypothetical protein
MTTVEVLTHGIPAKLATTLVHLHEITLQLNHMNRELEPSMRAVDYQRIIKFRDSLDSFRTEIVGYIDNIESQYSEFHVPDSQFV